MKSRMIPLVTLMTLIITGCSSPPSDEAIRNEISEYAGRCSWEIRDVAGKGISQTFSGHRITVAQIDLTARSFDSQAGSVRFALAGSKTGEGDLSNWYGFTREGAAPYLSDSFRYEGEWTFKKYDKGWKVADEPKTLVAYFQTASAARSR